MTPRPQHAFTPGRSWDGIMEEDDRMKRETAECEVALARDQEEIAAQHERKEKHKREE